MKFVCGDAGEYLDAEGQRHRTASDNNMIVETEKPEQVRPLFERYLWHMKQYFKIEDEKAWLEGANSYFSLYQTEPERKVYIVSAKDELCGFAFVNRDYRFNTSGNVMAEFYIAPEVQGDGYGRALAAYVFSQQPGAWEVCVTSANSGAHKFWSKVIPESAKENYALLSKDSYDGNAFVFNS